MNEAEAAALRQENRELRTQTIQQSETIGRLKTEIAELTRRFDDIRDTYDPPRPVQAGSLALAARFRSASFRPFTTGSMAK